MIAQMAPRLTPGRFVFVTGAPEALSASALATYREDEGMSLILPLEVAATAGLDTTLPMRCITLQVHSALDGVGLTAAVADALAGAAIPCNVVAAYHHDHIFVPEDRTDDAMACLTALSEAAGE